MRKTDYEFKYIGSCSVCGTPYEARNARILVRKADLSNIYAQCLECKSSAIVFVLKSAAGFVTTIGMLTDMVKEDIDKFKKMKPISADDVLEFHKALEE